MADGSGRDARALGDLVRTLERWVNGRIGLRLGSVAADLRDVLSVADVAKEAGFTALEVQDTGDEATLVRLRARWPRELWVAQEDSNGVPHPKLEQLGVDGVRVPPGFKSGSYAARLRVIATLGEADRDAANTLIMAGRADLVATVVRPSIATPQQTSVPPPSLAARRPSHAQHA